MTDPPAARTRAALAAALGVLALYLLVAGSSTLWDRDEPRFARATVEMLRSGNWLVPTYEGALRPHKPILIYWLMAGAMRVLGPSAFAARLVSVVAAALTALVVFRAGRTLFSARAGLLAAALLAVSPLMLLEGTAATTDAVLLLFVSASIGLLAEAIARGGSARAATLFALTLALAQLTKGPVGLAVPLLVLGGTLLLSRRAPALAPRFTRALLLGSAASLALFLLWAIPANAATGGRFLAEGFGRHVVGRSLAPMEGHGGRFLASLPYYVPVIAVGFLPGTLYLPGALSALAGGRLGERTRALLLAWILAPLALFTLVATKLPHYVLPIWPALALACAGTLESAREGRLAPRDVAWLRRGVWLYSPLAAGTAVACAFLPWRLGIGGLVGPGVLLALLAGGFGAFGVAEHLAGRYERGALVLTCGAAAMALVLALGALPAVERLKPVPPLVAAIRARGAERAPLATYAFEEPSLTFASGAESITHLASASDVAAWARGEQDGVLVAPRAELERLGPLPLEEIASANGWNVAKGRRLELVALRRR